LAGKSITKVLFSKQSDAVKRAEGLEPQIRKHLGWIEDEPNGPAANHWRGEVKGWLDQIREATKRMGQRTGDKWNQFVDESLKRLGGGGDMP
jgi:hypothetical protein